MRLYTIKVNGRTYQTTNGKEAAKFGILWNIPYIQSKVTNGPKIDYIMSI